MNLAAGLCDSHVGQSSAKAARTMTATSTPTDSITILRSDTPLAKEVVIGEYGLPVVGRVKMGFLFDVTERTVAGLNDLHEML